VEGGGGLALLAGRLGHVKLAEAVRFAQEWERTASLGLRRGDQEALENYDRHGRITGNEPDFALDQARAAYLGAYLQGRDVLMIGSLDAIAMADFSSLSVRTWKSSSAPRRSSSI
jgi:hypothetical protein